MMTPKANPRPSSRRLWWLIAVLMILLNVAAWQRKSIARWIGHLAMTRAEKGDEQGAREYLEIAETVSRHAPESQLWLARLERRNGDFGAARQHLQRARYLGIDAERADREEWLAVAQSGRMRLAEPELARLLETAEGDVPEICQAYALGYMRLRDFASALALLGGWAEEYPSDARPHAWIGQIQLELNATAEAEAAFRRALELDPANASAAFGLGQLLADAKRPAEAIPFFRIAVEDEDVGAAAAAGLAAGLQSQNQIADAASALDRALERFPSDHRLLVKKADLFIEKGQYAEAEGLLRPQVDAGSRRRELRYAYAMALRGLGRADEAAEHFAYATEAAEKIAAANQRIVKVSDEPKNAQLRYEIGAAHLQYGNAEDGLLWLHGALEIEPDHRAAHRDLAEYYQAKTSEDPRFISLAQRHRALAGPQEPEAHPETP